jgi:hypothetical protein
MKLTKAQTDVLRRASRRQGGWIMPIRNCGRRQADQILDALVRRGFVGDAATWTRTVSPACLIAPIINNAGRTALAAKGGK